MELSKKVAYLKGLMEGLKIDDSTNEGKILTIMADILDEMSATVEDIAEEVDETVELVDTLDEDLGKIEELIYGDDDDDDDEDGGEATLSEQNLYRRLSEYYDLLEDLDSQVRGCAQNFNGNYLEEDRTTRQNLADVAERTEDTIEQYYDIVEDLDVPTSSKNYSSWKDIIALYDDLDHRIDAICDAWEISLKYAKPADHRNEIGRAHV